MMQKTKKPAQLESIEYKTGYGSKNLEKRVKAKPLSFYNGKYKGYSVKLKAVREGMRYEPYKIKGPDDVYNFLKELESEDKEKFLSVMLDSKNQVLGVDEVSVGSTNMSAVDPKEVFKTAILYNSVSLIFTHNHPSGDPTPSSTDIELTKNLKKGLELLGLKLLDHVIIGYGKYKSLSDEGILKNDK